jgi:hypothetical protein
VFKRRGKIIIKFGNLNEQEIRAGGLARLQAIGQNSPPQRRHDFCGVLQFME